MRLFATLTFLLSLVTVVLIAGHAPIHPQIFSILILSASLSSIAFLATTLIRGICNHDA